MVGLSVKTRSANPTFSSWPLDCTIRLQMSLQKAVEKWLGAIALSLLLSRAREQAVWGLF
jgi:hypothetical protein